MKILKITAIVVALMCIFPCCASQAPAQSSGGPSVDGSMELSFATQFAVKRLADGCSLISVNEGGRFLVVPEGQEPPRDLDADVAVLRQPIENIYLAATSAMCLFDALDALDNVTLSGTKAEGWYIESARAAMENGEIVYAGKYSAPDYELLMASGCGLAVESTMISHSPEVKEKLEELGISVLVERSSYEQHPLGRTEWIKLYGVLLGKEELAAKLFAEQMSYLDGISSGSTGKTVAFFYINSAGGAVARQGGDYIAQMIGLAGGEYVFAGEDANDSAAGSLNLEMERFYTAAKDADVMIYNSSIDGEVRTMDELLAKSHLLADFKAVQAGEVWCTPKNFFQETTGFGLLISDMHRVFTEDTGDMHYLYKLS